MTGELSAAEVRRITDEKGVCPVCEATPERIVVPGVGIALYWPHQPWCPSVEDPNEAVMTETKPINDNLTDWEKKAVDG